MARLGIARLGKAKRGRAKRERGQPSWWPPLSFQWARPRSTTQSCRCEREAQLGADQRLPVDRAPTGDLRPAVPQVL
jgi:hypothetical protein